MRIVSQSIGTILIQTAERRSDEDRDPALIVYPYLMNELERDAAIEWAAGTQAPFYCREEDIRFLESQGFGRYRFHSIGGYREIGLHGGSVELYPARRDVPEGWRRTATEFAEYFGFLTPQTVNILIRPRSEYGVLYLSSPALDAAEWKVLSAAAPHHLICSSRSNGSRWEELLEKWGKKWVGEIVFERDSRELNVKSKEPKLDPSSAVKESHFDSLWTTEEQKLSH